MNWQHILLKEHPFQFMILVALAGSGLAGLVLLTLGAKLCWPS